MSEINYIYHLLFYILLITITIASRCKRVNTLGFVLGMGGMPGTVRTRGTPGTLGTVGMPGTVGTL